MRSVFPAYFRPSTDDYAKIWSEGIFSLDANVLLNLYRYSSEARKELESALTGVKGQLFITHQAAKEFLRNRITVTASQADEYNKATRSIAELTATISNKKKHPFLDDGELPPFLTIMDEVNKQLEAQKHKLLKRLTEDEILDFVEGHFDQRTGPGFDADALTLLTAEGEKRYEHEIPPGYKDGKKDQSGDPHRKFGDLIVWKQLINESKKQGKPLIFITDDQKEDWWLEQSGRTIGPRPELREEFLNEAGQDFWMYTVDRFIAESAKSRNTVVSDQVIAEIIEVREETNTERATTRTNRFRSISRDDLIERIQSSEKWAYQNGVPFLGLVSYVKNYLGNAGYEYDASFDMIKQLEDEGILEVYDHQGPGHEHSVKAIKLCKRDALAHRPFENLRASLHESGQGGDG